MNCANHPVRQGVNTCSKCGEWLCDECGVELNGRIICKKCLAKMADSGSGYGYTVKREHKSSANIFLTLFFSGLPGANYMYLGLVKRGLFVLSAFFLSIYMTQFTHFAAFLMAGITITSFFDGLRIRRRIIAGEYVTDDVSDIKKFFSENKAPLITAGTILIVLQLMSDISKFLSRALPMGRYFHSYSSGLLPIVILGMGIYFLSKPAGGKKKEHKDKDDTDQYQ